MLREIIVLVIFASITVVLSIDTCETTPLPSMKHTRELERPNENVKNEITCDDFSRSARFNPYSVLNVNWIAFYYWSKLPKPFAISFHVPDAKEREILNHTLDLQTAKSINWTSRHLVMLDIMENVKSLIVERAERGQYWLYKITKNDGDLLTAIDIRFKQTSDNKYIAIMFCKKQAIYVMTRNKDLQNIVSFQEEAAKLGIQQPGGKSHFEEGYEWQPQDEPGQDTNYD